MLNSKYTLPNRSAHLNFKRWAEQRICNRNRYISHRIAAASAPPKPWETWANATAQQLLTHMYTNSRFIALPHASSSRAQLRLASRNSRCMRSLICIFLHNHFISRMMLWHAFFLFHHSMAPRSKGTKCARGELFRFVLGNHEPDSLLKKPSFKIINLSNNKNLMQAHLHQTCVELLQNIKQSSRASCLSPCRLSSQMTTPIGIPPAGTSRKTVSMIAQTLFPEPFAPGTTSPAYIEKVLRYSPSSSGDTKTMICSRTTWLRRSMYVFSASSGLLKDRIANTTFPRKCSARSRCQTWLMQNTKSQTIGI